MAGWSEQEFDAFVASRLPRLVRVGYALTGDLGHSEDVVQTALAKTYLATRRRTLDDPEAYVRPAVVTANISRFRRRRVVEDLVEVVPEPPATDTESGLERREAVQRLLAGLSPRQLTVLVLRYQEDWSEQEIAVAMGVFTGTVKTLASRAMARLRATTRPEERSEARAVRTTCARSSPRRPGCQGRCASSAPHRRRYAGGRDCAAQSPSVPGSRCWRSAWCSSCSL